MAETRFSWDSIPWTRVCPWLRVTRAFWIAADPRKLLLATVAMLAMSGVYWSIEVALPLTDAVVIDGSLPEESAASWPWDVRLGYDLWQTDDPIGEVGVWMEDPRGTLWRLASNWKVVLLPLEFLTRPLGIFSRLPTSGLEWVRSAVMMLAGTIVWGFFGGAIGRMAAVNFARDQQLSISRSLWFSISHLPGYLAGPLLPLGGIGLCLVFMSLLALLGRIDVAGPVIVGCSWGLALLFGFATVVLLLGLAAGWPLMVATINVEGSDGFDGFSRSYNYTFERPWYYLFSVALVMTYGSLVIYFFWLCGQLLFRMASYGLLIGAGTETTQLLLADLPPLLAAESWGDVEQTRAAVAMGFWGRVIATLIVAFVHSYFWTATTIIYFLLRRSVDSSDFNEVFLDGAAEPDPLLPIVGTAAMNPAPPAPPVAQAVDLSP
jgi:hypothetical protein